MLAIREASILPKARTCCGRADAEIICLLLFLGPSRPWEASAPIFARYYRHYTSAGARVPKLAGGKVAERAFSSEYRSLGQHMLAKVDRCANLFLDILSLPIFRRPAVRFAIFGRHVDWPPLPASHPPMADRTAPRWRS